MAISSEINFSQLEDRSDAKFFSPKYLKNEKILDRCKLKIFSLGQISDKIVDGPFGSDLLKSEYVKVGIPLFRVKCIKEGWIDFSDMVYISKEKQKKLKRSKVESEDVVLTKAGTIGVACVVPKEIQDANITSHLAVIKLKKDRNPYYVSTFLNSRFGRLQIMRWGIKTTRPELNLSEVSKTRVPIPSENFQQKIKKVITKALKKKSLAGQRYKQAKQLLEKELKFDKLKLKEEKIFGTKFTAIEKTMRFDSEYHQPKYKQIVSFLQKKGAKKLKEVVKISTKKIDPTKQPTKKFKYIELANINPSTGEIENVEELSGYQLPSRARMLIRTGDILVASLSGSLDNVGLVTGEFDNEVASTGFFIISSNVYNSEVLFLLFKNRLLKAQLEQKTAGAIMTAVPKTSFGDLLIPKLPKSKQEKISEWLKDSFKLRKESKLLLDKAKQEVEKLILGKS